MTPEELEVQKCLDRVFEYCKQHGGSCRGCIFFKLIQMGHLVMPTCRVMYAPEVFGRSQRGTDDD